MLTRNISTAMHLHPKILTLFWSLKNEDEVMVEEIDQLKDLGVNHFSKNFKDDGRTCISDQLKIIQHFPSMLSDEEVSMFTSQVTLVEVEGALKAFRRDKILGLNGWPIEFYL